MRILQKIKAVNSENLILVKRVFTWLVESTVPPTLDQLAEAISIEPEDVSRDLDAIATDPSHIIGLCGGLVTVESGSRSSSTTVGLAHLSVKEYMTSSTILAGPVSDFYLDPLQGSADLVRTCIQYLGILDFALPCSSLESQVQRLQTYPLLEYATKYWYIHFLRCAKVDVQISHELNHQL